jgi:hypothetical protein
MNFRDLHDRLVVHLRRLVGGGEMTERGLARVSGISQPHLHNVLKGKRLFSTEAADEILRRMHLDIFDLIGDEDLVGRNRQR